jgi:D-alanyl-lipoteichoic acid acyltransferase DltB (MBOAT superfamily)
MSILDRLALLPLITIFIFYPLIAWPILRWTSQRYRLPLFAGLNVLGLLALIIAETAESVPLSWRFITLYLEISASVFLVYLLFVVLSFAIFRWSISGGERRAWIAFLFPLFFLGLIKYWPASHDPLRPSLMLLGGKHRSEFFIGISYMAFRLSHLLREVQNGGSPAPSISEYLAFAFFVPAIPVGPISPYSKMHQSLSRIGNSSIPVGEAWLRILVGLTKYLFLSTILNQFTYAGLLLDGHPHRVIDLLIAIPAYTLFLYCNFSGFCDMVVGLSALLGIEVSENFDQPFLARNLQEFWNRWHITLSAWFRDMMFTPMLKELVRRFGPKSMNLMIAVTILSVFAVLGVWHGTGMNFLIFGLLQGIGVVLVHFYRLALKRFLSKSAFAAYQRNPIIRGASIAVTFAYFSFTLFFFANSIDDMHRIAHAII